MVASAVYPGLERKPGGPDNWVEKAGGLPSYIERIAKHLHYEQGMMIDRAIATAVNTVKRWARGGPAVEGGKGHVSAKTQAQAAKALAEWNAKKVKATSMTADGQVHFDLSRFLEPVTVSKEDILLAVQRVQTAAGVARYGAPIGSLIQLKPSEGASGRPVTLRPGQTFTVAGRQYTVVTATASVITLRDGKGRTVKLKKTNAGWKVSKPDAKPSVQTK